MPDIILPTAEPRRPVRLSAIDPDFITIEEAETRAQATGQQRGMTVEYSDDGSTWVEAWSPSGDILYPQFARATVIRKYPDGDEIPTRVVVRWDEFFPHPDDENYTFWTEKPTVMLGKVAKMSAFRGSFRDVIGNAYVQAEFDRAPRPMLAVTA